MASQLRRTRIVCISDTHNCTVKLPDGDVLIHAGDLTNQGSYSELSRAVKWLENTKFEAKIVIAGNHDITLDETFYTDHGLEFHNQNLQSHADCLSLFTSSPSITYLDHSSATIRLSSPSGPHTQFNVFGSPQSPRCGHWAFSYDYPPPSAPDSDLPDLWDAIPLSSDIVVTHTPPRNHCDETADHRSAGCEALRRALWRVRPHLAVCGHVHSGRGAKRVAWDLSSPNIPFLETDTTTWEDPAQGSSSNSKKMSLVDLTGRKAFAAPALDNDGGSHPHCSSSAGPSPARGGSPGSISSSSDTQQVCTRTTIGPGGDASSRQCDVDALEGRMGRRETCIVNAAIVQTGYPHIGGKKLTKPIVVDLDLPVWEEEKE
ncbi:hypothetical protein ACO1O0_003542 [Amphichorda felina]